MDLLLKWWHNECNKSQQTLIAFIVALLVATVVGEST